MTERRTAASVEAAVGGVLIMALALPPLRMWLEASLVGHVLAQMPLLALSGWLLGTAFAPRPDKIVGRWNRGGIAGLALVIFTILFWMLPRSIDRAVQGGGYEVLKFVWLPCAGVALAISFGRAHPLVAGALKANLISMLAVLAWLYTATPVRLCNSYLKGDQERLGLAMAFLAVALAMTWGAGLLFGPRRTSSAGNVPLHGSGRQLGDPARPWRPAAVLGRARSK
jgi:hypothetical protein